ncbi:MAG: hypothetical protein D6719_04315 [Candidatus Dadabacteria bacterium]|nr:MAG: hypothetical protein D6719_04315 [Candidatus Dadabacteria bacterium]
MAFLKSILRKFRINHSSVQCGASIPEYVLLVAFLTAGIYGPLQNFQQSHTVASLSSACQNLGGGSECSLDVEWLNGGGDTCPDGTVNVGGSCLDSCGSNGVIDPKTGTCIFLSDGQSDDR